MPRASSEKEYSKEIQDSLKDILALCEKEDDEIRKAMVRTWKKHEEFWHGVQYLFWSARDETWRSPLDLQWREEFSDEELEEIGSFYDYVIDIFRAHGESIIAALAAQIPVLRFIPDDADSEEDVVTARTYSKIADVVQRHNKAKLLFLKALYFLYINGNVLSYRYKESDFKYGTYRVPNFTINEQDVQSFHCPDCGDSSDAVRDMSSPCPECGSTERQEERIEKRKVPVRQEDTVLPKTRAKVEVFGPLFYKIPYYAMNQSQCGYLILYMDVPKDLVKFTYKEKDLENEIEGEYLDTSDRFSRSDFQYPTDPQFEQKEMLTVKRVWLRPQTFFKEKDEKKREKLLKEFPDGVYVVFLGKTNIYAEAEPENMDDRIQLGKAGLSTYIYADAVCRPVVSVQEMRNQAANLVIETIEHGIPSEFADPSVLSFDQYGRFEAVPGYIYKAKPVSPSATLGQSFYTSQRSTLAKEVPGFIKQLDQDAQFTLGSFPSIYGGPSEGKSRTFAEYAASRQMALQRLSILWNFVVDWWMETMYGLVKMYVECVVEDEKFVQYKDGNYVNVWIRKSDLMGKVGGVEPEASESFPMSLTQKKDLIMKLMELNNEFINAALYQPENARIIQDVLALGEFKLPGEAQRVKQISEINEMIKPGVEPIQLPGLDPNKPQFKSTVSVDPDVDDHAIHSATVRAFLVDTVGQDLARTNPQAYMNCIAHKREHDQYIIQATANATATSAPGVPPPTNQVGQEE